MAARKFRAEDRTVDMFSGSTREEEARAAIEEVPQEQRQEYRGIEGEEDRWADSAFRGQEWTTKLFYTSSEQHQTACAASAFRLTMKGGWMYLEKKEGQQDKAFHYAGVMFTETDLWLLTQTLVKKAWAKDQEKTKSLFKEVCK